MRAGAVIAQLATALSAPAVTFPIPEHDDGRWAEAHVQIPDRTTFLVLVQRMDADAEYSERGRAARLQDRLGIMVQATGRGYAIVDYDALDKLASKIGWEKPAE